VSEALSVLTNSGRFGLPPVGSLNRIAPANPASPARAESGVSLSGLVQWQSTTSLRGRAMVARCHHATLKHYECSCIPSSSPSLARNRRLLTYPWVAQNLSVPPVSFGAIRGRTSRVSGPFCYSGSSSHRLLHLCPGWNADPKAALSSECPSSGFNGAGLSRRWTRLTSLIVRTESHGYTTTLSRKPIGISSCVGLCGGQMSIQWMFAAKGAWLGIVSRVE